MTIELKEGEVLTVVLAKGTKKIRLANEEGEISCFLEEDKVTFEYQCQKTLEELQTEENKEEIDIDKKHVEVLRDSVGEMRLS